MIILPFSSSFSANRSSQATRHHPYKIFRMLLKITGKPILTPHAASRTIIHKSPGGFDDAHKPQEHAVWRTAVSVFVQGKHKNTSRCRSDAGAFIVTLIGKHGKLCNVHLGYGLRTPLQPLRQNFPRISPFFTQKRNSFSGFSANLLIFHYLSEFPIPISPNGTGFRFYGFACVLRQIQIVCPKICPLQCCAACAFYDKGNAPHCPC